MTACIKCGFDSERGVVATWTLNIARRVPSLNDRTFNAGRSRWKYAEERDVWRMEFRVERVNHRMPKVTRYRRVTLTRVYSGLEKERDRDNFIGGCKPIVDAMVRENLIVDDDGKNAEIFYAQERADLSGLRVLIEELA